MIYSIFRGHKQGKNVKIIGYARLSSKEQDAGITLSQQISRLKEAGAEEVLYDLESGSSIKRKSLTTLMDMVSKGEVKKIICTRIDRLSRKTSDGLALMSNMFEKYKVNFEFLDTPQLSISDANGKFVLTIMLASAELEANMFKQRSKNGRDYRKANNFPHANPPFGYVTENKERYALNSKGFLCILETEKEYSKADIARDIIEEFFKVKSSRKTMENIHKKYDIPKRYYGSHCKIKDDQRELALPHEMKLNDWIRNPVLRGHTAYSKINQREKASKYVNTEDWDIRENTHPKDRLISEDEWILLQSILNTKAIHKGGKYPETKRYFVGLTYCANCGANATTRVSSSKNRHEYYFCRNLTCTKDAIRHDALSQEIVKAILKKRLIMKALQYKIKTRIQRQ